MNKQIHNAIKKIEKKGLSDIELLALVTETSYEVIFYAKYDGKMRQSNELAEDGVISLDFADEVYEEVANIIRSYKKYNSEKMNIIKASKNKIKVEYDDKKCRVYGLKKKWKEEIGV